MNALAREASAPPREIPDFLQHKEPLAQYAYWSNHRLLIVKGETAVSLSPDDLASLRRFFDQFSDGESS